MYSDRVAKNEETSSIAASPDTLLALIGTIGSDPKDLKVHKRGCRTIFEISAGLTDLSLGTETERAGDLGGRSGKEERNWE